MKSLISLKVAVILFLLSSVSLLGYPVVSFAEEQRPFIAVMGFQAASPDIADVANAVADKFAATLIASNKFKVVERSAIGLVLQEQARQLSGCTSTECAVEIGRLLSVQKIIVGNISKIGSSYYITARLINVETGMVEKQEEITCECVKDLPALLKSAEILAGKIMDLTITPIITAKSKTDLEIEKKIMYRNIGIGATAVGAVVAIVGASQKTKVTVTEQYSYPYYNGSSWVTISYTDTHEDKYAERKKKTTQTVLLASGGALAIGGGILWYSNQRSINRLKKEKGRITYQVVPIYDGETVGGVVQVRF